MPPSPSSQHRGRGLRGSAHWLPDMQAHRRTTNHPLPALHQLNQAFCRWCPAQQSAHCINPLLAGLMAEPAGPCWLCLQKISMSSSSSSPFPPLFSKAALQANAPTTFMLLVEEDAVQRSQLILELLQSHQILLHFRLKEGRGKKREKKKRKK